MSPPVIRIRSSAVCSASRVAPYHTVVIHLSPSFCNRSRLSRSTGVPYPTHARGSTCNPYTDFCGMHSHRTWHVIYCGMRPPSFSYPYLWFKLSILKSIFGHGLPRRAVISRVAWHLIPATVVVATPRKSIWRVKPRSCTQWG